MPPSHTATTDGPVRVLLLEAGTFAREGLEPFLRPHGDIDVVGIASDASMAIRIAHLAPPHVVFINLPEPGDAASMLRDVRRRLPAVRIALRMPQADAALARGLRQAGVDALLFGDARPADVVGTVRRLGTIAMSARMRA